MQLINNEAVVFIATYLKTVCQSKTIKYRFKLCVYIVGHVQIEGGCGYGMQSFMVLYLFLLNLDLVLSEYGFSEVLDRLILVHKEVIGYSGVRLLLQLLLSLGQLQRRGV